MNYPINKESMVMNGGFVVIRGDFCGDSPSIFITTNPDKHGEFLLISNKTFRSPMTDPCMVD